MQDKRFPPKFDENLTVRDRYENGQRVKMPADEKERRIQKLEK